jgi:hypothetical protein
MATLPVQIVSSLKRTLPFLHYSHESFLFFEVPVSVFDPDVFLFQSEDDEENLENDGAKLLGSQEGKPVNFADEKERVKEKE